MALTTKAESYSERRMLFRNIWDTAMQIDHKDPEIMNKPKVIKTLRLDEVDKFAIGKRKKERIKNLRTVCRKILDFCDRQDEEDDRIYEQVMQERLVDQNIYPNRQKKKRTIHPGTRKIKQMKSTLSPKPHMAPKPRATTSEDKNNFLEDFRDTSRLHTLMDRRNKISVIKPPITRRPLKRNLSPINTSTIIVYGDAKVARRKVVKKKHNKRKHFRALLAPPISSDG